MRYRQCICKRPARAGTPAGSSARNPAGNLLGDLAASLSDTLLTRAAAVVATAYAYVRVKWNCTFMVRVLLPPHQLLGKAQSRAFTDNLQRVAVAVAVVDSVAVWR